MAQFKNLIFKALENERGRLRESSNARALLKMLVEIRESAKKNEDYDEYETVTEELKAFGVDLHEETRITARTKED